MMMEEAQEEAQNACALSTNIPLVNGERHMAKPRAGNVTAHRSEGHYKLHGIGHGELGH